MNHEKATQFAQRIAEDAKLREEFRADPVGVSQGAGLDLTDEETRIASGMSGLPEKEMIARASKCLF
jgi:hypothetical protein